ncbi:MAG: hypothetical protein HYZ28_03200 [Myxococcales bacterium]|nr:hypothetical protein [Myxococcales bacterium]
MERAESGYRIRVDCTQSPPQMAMSGSVRVTEPGELKEFFGQVHSALVGCGACEVVVDLRDLDFLNSTAFKPLVHWLGLIDQLPVDGRYTVRFRIAKERHWQKPCLGALSCFSPLLVTVEGA